MRMQCRSRVGGMTKVHHRSARPWSGRKEKPPSLNRTYHATRCGLLKARFPGCRRGPPLLPAGGAGRIHNSKDGVTRRNGGNGRPPAFPPFPPCLCVTCSSVAPGTQGRPLITRYIYPTAPRQNLRRIGADRNIWLERAAKVLPSPSGALVAPSSIPETSRPRYAIHFDRAVTPDHYETLRRHGRAGPMRHSPCRDRFPA